jgi:3',5'-cyclic AMP phosphodiesterase CpdA
MPVSRDEELRVMGVNTARPISFSRGFWKDGRVSRGQLREVEGWMCGPEGFKVVVTHHPFIPPPGARAQGMVVGRAAEALGAMERCGVDLLLAGHLHKGYSGDVRPHFEAIERSILSVQAGTAISTRRRHEPNGYNFITIAAHEVTIDVRAFDGGRFESSEIKRYRKSENVWRES